jgi:2-phospho-L-lactate transferase/gluconeogenesis factor (CofD/UPF0052 family)
MSSTVAVRVVLFSGGRGSGALTELLAADARIALTIAINGYDDGASTGEVRRFLGDALGPSDFRKNGSRVARLRRSASDDVVALLDARLPVGATAQDFQATLDRAAAGGPTLAAVTARLRTFETDRLRSAQPVDFSDASVGNFVFAGAFIANGRNFNAAVDDYCALLGLPAGLIDNVTDGTNAFLVALDENGVLLGSEEEIVDARRRNAVRDIFLIDRPIAAGERARLEALPVEARQAALEARAVAPPLNPRVAAALAGAHLIIYAPGTQHSSLFPSYLTRGLGTDVAGNLAAIKLLVTNIQEDAEIGGRSAVDLVDRAVYYLRDKGRLTTSVPCLITHYLLNDPGHGEPGAAYVPLGKLESLEDPRLVRVGNYEAGGTGRHDAVKVLTPYIDGLIARERAVERVAVVLGETHSSSKVVQTMLEMVRGGTMDLPVDVTVFHAGDKPIEQAFLDRLPFAVRAIRKADPEAQDRELRDALRAGGFGYVVLFDSSGMYNGEDIAGLASHLTRGRLDAVWGSRRLSLRDIDESYRLRYRGNAIQGALSAVGSHVLSLQFLVLFGRYVADTLSGARVVRTADVLAASCRLSDQLLNQYLLSDLLRRRAEILEIPVQFFAISPDQVRRTTVGDGVRSISIAVRQRFRRPTRSATKA